jgi:hypothetical protein
MWRGERSPGADVARGEPSPGADAGGVSPVPAQMWQRVIAVPVQMWVTHRMPRITVPAAPLRTAASRPAALPLALAVRATAQPGQCRSCRYASAALSVGHREYSRGYSGGIGSAAAVSFRPALPCPAPPLPAPPPGPHPLPPLSCLPPQRGGRRGRIRWTWRTPRRRRSPSPSSAPTPAGCRYVPSPFLAHRGGYSRRPLRTRRGRPSEVPEVSDHGPNGADGRGGKGHSLTWSVQAGVIGVGATVFVFGARSVHKTHACGVCLCACVRARACVCVCTRACLRCVYEKRATNAGVPSCVDQRQPSGNGR